MNRRLTYWKGLPLTHFATAFSLIPSVVVEERSLPNPDKDFDLILKEVKALECMYQVEQLHEPTLLEADTAQGKFPR